MTAIDRLIESINADIARLSDENFEQFMGLKEYRRVLAGYRKELTRALFYKRVAEAA